MTDLDKALRMLKSPQASVRYDACEELIAATESTPEVILALEEASQDENKVVAERARKALDAKVRQQMAIKVGRLPTGEEPDWSDRPLTDALNPGDTMYAVGKVRRRFDEFFGTLGDTGLLVRTGDGSYYVVDEGKPGKTEIRGVINKPISSLDYKTVNYYVGLVADASVIGFWPYDLYPDKIPMVMLFQKVSADFMFSRIKELEELEILQQCPICDLIRPVDVPQCSNPECAALSEKESRAPTSYWNSLGCFYSTPIYLVLFVFLWWKHFRITGDIIWGKGGPVYNGEEVFCLSAILPALVIAVLLYSSANAVYNSKSPLMRKILRDDPNSTLTKSLQFVILIVTLLIPVLLFWFALDWLFGLIVGPVQYRPLIIKDIITQNFILIIAIIIFVIISSIVSQRKKGREKMIQSSIRPERKKGREKN